MSKTLASPPMDGFAAGGEAPPESFHLWDLASADPRNYQNIFDRAVAPRVEDFYGHKMNGVILYVNNWFIGKVVFSAYTGFHLDSATGTLFSRPLTFQKRFYKQDNAAGESGVNFWPMRGCEAMPMKIYVGPAICAPGADSLKIDYAVASNNALTERPILDEIRRIPESDLYLGKMYFRAGKTHILFLWFALEKAD